ncbi:MAG: FKBP-type peptidyl-prolyl cis-trans isomerase [Thermoplasmata archaeon]
MEETVSEIKENQNQNKSISKNDFVYIDVDEYAIDENNKEELIDTTIKESDVNNTLKKNKYAPYGIIVGASFVFKALEDELEKMEIGQESIFTFTPEQTYGKKDPELIKLYPIQEVLKVIAKYKLDITPAVGVELPMPFKEDEYGEPTFRTGKILMLTAGRARIDFNNKYSGKNIKMKVKLLKKVESIPEKIKLIIEHYYSNADDFVIEDKDNEIIINIPERTWNDHNWFHSKEEITTKIREYVDKKKKISYIETHLGIEEPNKENIAEESKPAENQEKQNTDTTS